MIRFDNKFTFKQRFKILIVVLLVLFTVNLGLVNYVEEALKEDNSFAEVTRKNTNHIHRTVFFARNIIEGKRSNINDLAKEIKLIDENYQLILKGGAYYDRNFENIILPPLPEKFASQYTEVFRLWLEMKKKLLVVVENSSKLDSTFNYYQKVGFLSEEEQDIFKSSKAQDKDDIFDLDNGDKSNSLDIFGMNNEADSLSLDNLFNEPVADNDFSNTSRQLNNTLNDGSDGYISITRTFKIVNPLVTPSIEYVINNVEKVLLFNQNLTSVFVVEFINHQKRLRIVMGLLWIFNIAFIIYLYFFVISSTTAPIEFITKEIQQIAKGDVKKSKLPKSDSEIGKLVASINTLSDNLDKVTDYAAKVGAGEFSANFEVRSDKDVLGYALISMSDNLKKNVQEDIIRNWTNEGMAKFGDILRVSHRQINELSYHIISNLVNYLNANQGGIFILNNEDESEPYLKMTASYAYNKRKYIEKQVLVGQGLIGQAVLEEATIHTDKIPNGYVYVTSGLGEATPSSLLIVPLKLSQKVYGAIEIASFSKFEPYQVAFVEKISESIAATIATVKANDTTVKLLEESQFFSEQMRAQEEEMRQNMEELTSTQEEMARTQKELTKKVSALKETIDSSKSWIVSLNLKYSIRAINKSYAEYIRKAFGTDVKEGMNFFHIFPADLQQEWIDLYAKAINGEHVSIIKNIKDIDHEDVYYMIDIDPVFDNKGNVASIVVFVRDITFLSPVRWE